MIRKAVQQDIDAVTRIYEHILDREEAGDVTIGWQRGVYPTRATAQKALDADELYVMHDENDRILAAAWINNQQVDAYQDAKWAFDAPNDRVLVLHTLVVEPNCAAKGCGTAFVHFYEQMAWEMGCPYLRMDTNAVNVIARRLYQKLGYSESDVVPCTFNGIEGVQLVCLEKYLAHAPEK